MNFETFRHQVRRLQSRFTERALDPSFVEVLWADVSSMSDEGFVRCCNNMIAGRPHRSPPLLVDFRDARLADEKNRLSREVNEALKAFNKPAAFEGLMAYLAKEFPGCKSLSEAVEVRRLQIAVQKAENSSYDPMTDPKWMGAN